MSKNIDINSLSKEELKKYIDDFIRELGVVGDGIKYYIKVKNEYRTPDMQLINIDSERKVYLDKFKEIVT